MYNKKIYHNYFSAIERTMKSALPRSELEHCIRSRVTWTLSRGAPLDLRPLHVVIITRGLTLLQSAGLWPVMWSGFPSSSFPTTQPTAEADRYFTSWVRGRERGASTARAWPSCLGLSLLFWFVYYICLYFASWAACSFSFIPQSS